MGLNYYASSPVVVMPSRPPSQYFANGSQFNPSPHCNPYQPQQPLQQQLSSFQRKRFSLSRFPRPMMNQNNSNARPMITSTAGRKRTREEVGPSEDEHEDGSYFYRPTSTPAQLQAQPAFAPAPTPFYQNEQCLSSVHEPQAIDWAIGPREQESTPEPIQPERPPCISRKSQRLSGSSNSIDTVIRHDGPSAASSAHVSSTPCVQPAFIDEASFVLGIGWTKVSGDPNLEAAARGWARYIMKHFDMEAAEILLSSKSDGSFLVKALIGGMERYCLFTEDLRQYQLLAVAPGIPADNAEAALRCMRHCRTQLMDVVYQHESSSVQSQQQSPTSASSGDAQTDAGDMMIM